MKINMLSKATSVPGQGVGSAYIEQVNLVKQSKKLEVEINSRKSDFDIYHIHSINPQYKIRMNKKHINVVYVHFVPSKNEGSLRMPNIAQKIFDNYVNNMYKKADELVVVNPAFIKPLLDLGISQDKITYIPNYVDRTNFYALEEDKIDTLKDKYGIPKDKFVVLGVGQVQVRKGVDDFIEVAKKNPDIYFVWTGGFSFGSLTDGYDRYKEIMDNPPSNVKFLGIIPRDDMNEIYNISNLLFMPSYLELFPMSILEACNLSLPILLRDVNLYRPILFDKYCTGKSVDEFSLEINKLKDDESYYTKRRDDSDFISKFYSKEVLLDTWEKYYERIYNKYKK